MPKLLTQSVREAFELHRDRLLSRAEVESRLRPALLGLCEPRTRAAARYELLKLLPNAPFHPQILRALLSQKHAPYDDQARSFWRDLADAVGDRAEWRAPACGAWDPDEQQVLQRLAEGSHEKATDCELIFEALGPTIGRYNVELRWADEHLDAAKAAYGRFLYRGYNSLEANGSLYTDRLRSPWCLEDIAGYFRRSALLALFEDLAPLVEDVRFYCVTQMLRYEVWIVSGTCYVCNHPDDIDKRVGDVVGPLLRSHPTDEALRSFVILHLRREAEIELEAIGARRLNASEARARRRIEDCRALGGDVSDLGARLAALAAG